MTKNQEVGPDSVDLNEVVFVTGEALPPGSVVLHKSTTEKVRRQLAEVKADWERIVKQIAEMVAGSDGSVADSGFELQELSVGLAFSASGRLGFIAEAGVEASITVTFGRPKSGGA